MIVYTSGTTGVAKGAVLSHNNLAANGITLTAVWNITESDRYLAMLPLFHVHGLGNGVHSWLIGGCRMRLLERFDSAHDAGGDVAISSHARLRRADGLRPAARRSVVSDDAARAIGRRARLFVSGSAPLPAHVHEAFRARYGTRFSSATA